MKNIKNSQRRFAIVNTVEDIVNLIKNHKEFTTLEEIDEACERAVDKAERDAWHHIASSSNTNIFDRTFARIHLQGIDAVSWGCTIAFEDHDTVVKIIVKDQIEVEFGNIAKCEIGRNTEGRKYISWNKCRRDLEKLPYWVHKTTKMIIKAVF